MKYYTLSYGVEDGITCGIMERSGIIYDYGLTTVVTECEYIVVDDIVVSSFAGYISHSFQNKLANLLRFSYKVSPAINSSKIVHKISNFICP